jgi:Tol biopolymer transport system component
MFGRKRLAESDRAKVKRPAIQLSLELLESRETPSSIQLLSNAFADYPGGGFMATRNHFSISADGRFVAFESPGPGVIAGENLAGSNIYVYDSQTGDITRVSVGIGGAAPDGSSYTPTISADGRFVTFESSADNLVADDTTNNEDVFVYDRDTGTTTRVSVPLAGDGPDTSSILPVISADGRFVAYRSLQPFMTDLGGIRVFDRLAGTTSEIGRGDLPSISADGRFVAFAFGWSLYDREGGGTQFLNGPAGAAIPSISANGRFVALRAYTPDGRLYLYDIQSGSLTPIVPPGLSGPVFYELPSISADGRFVAFAVTSPSGAGSTDTKTDVYIYDQETGGYEVAIPNVADLALSQFADAVNPVISPDGRSIAFRSNALELVPGTTEPGFRLFLYTADEPTASEPTVGAPPVCGPMWAFTLPHSGGTAQVIGWDLTGDGAADCVIMSRCIHQRLNVTAFDVASRRAFLHFGLTIPRQMPQFLTALVSLNPQGWGDLVTAASRHAAESFGLLSIRPLLASA